MSSNSVVVPPGHILDYVSGTPVNAGPEEVESVQVFARRLVEDYRYPKTHLQTRPQYRVRKRPSDEAKSYPVDIAVFRTPGRTEGDLYMVVECKAPNKTVGVEQLKLYLDMSPAELGVWFNGNEHTYLRKIYTPSGGRTYQDLPNIPRYGQRIEDIGFFKRSDLVTPSNLKAVFRDIRNHLAAITTGITRDETFAQEIINLLFCKIFDEQDTYPADTVTFRAGVNEDANTVKTRISGLFSNVKSMLYDDMFEASDTINLDAESVRYVVGELQNYCVMDANRDAIGEAFEVFIGPALRGSEGQFFTPRNVVKMAVDILDPKPGEKIIDPACGSGGFLITALGHVWEQIRTEAKQKNWSDHQRAHRLTWASREFFYGIDKDSFLAKVSKAHMALIGDGRGGIFCENSLLPTTSWHHSTQTKVALESFDVVITNPPFGQQIRIDDNAILSQYLLGHKWARDKSTDSLSQTSLIAATRSPQILFLERCLQLLKPGGRMGIVLPESTLCNPSYEYFVCFIQQHAVIRGVVTMPESLFKTSGKGGTHTKVAVLFLEKRNIDTDPDYDIFMADAKWCGHDSRGNPTIRHDPATGTVDLLDDVPLVSERYRKLHTENSTDGDHLGFKFSVNKIENRILVPKYYNPEIEAELISLQKTHELLRIGDLQDNGVLSITTGIEVEKWLTGQATFRSLEHLTCLIGKSKPTLSTV